MRRCLQTGARQRASGDRIKALQLSFSPSFASDKCIGGKLRRCLHGRLHTRHVGRARLMIGLLRCSSCSLDPRTVTQRSKSVCMRAVIRVLYLPEARILMTPCRSPFLPHAHLTFNLTLMVSRVIESAAGLRDKWAVTNIWCHTSFPYSASFQEKANLREVCE